MKIQAHCFAALSLDEGLEASTSAAPVYSVMPSANAVLDAAYGPVGIRFEPVGRF